MNVLQTDNFYPDFGVWFESLAVFKIFGNAANLKKLTDINSNIITNRCRSILKWIKEQVCEILKLPNLYNDLVRIMEYTKFERSEHITKAEYLENLVLQYCKE